MHVSPDILYNSNRRDECASSLRRRRCGPSRDAILGGAKGCHSCFRLHDRLDGNKVAFSCHHIPYPTANHRASRDCISKWTLDHVHIHLALANKYKPAMHREWTCFNANPSVHARPSIHRLTHTSLIHVRFPQCPAATDTRYLTILASYMHGVVWDCAAGRDTPPA